VPDWRIKTRPDRALHVAVIGGIESRIISLRSLVLSARETHRIHRRAGG
jgi:hypothetical protein